MYHITEYTKKQAKLLGVMVKPSTNKKKKIDVYKDDKKIASVGAIGYNDYPTFIQKEGKTYADKRRKLYRQRHKKDMNKPNTNGYYANKLLW